MAERENLKDSGERGRIVRFIKDRPLIIRV